MKDYCQYVNVFQGCDEIDLPEPTGLAKQWRWIKGLCGNCSPGAALPFGRISACCYSGGYSSGYGRLKKNTHGPIGKLWNRNKFRGISHLQNDGTGDIETFYNYAVLSPYAGDVSAAAEARDFTGETACPGYYACRDSETGALCEVTVTPLTALHRITFPGDSGKISIDFSNDGLYDDGGHLRAPAGKARLTLTGENEAAAEVVLQGVTVYFYIRVSGRQGILRLWVDGKETDDREIELPEGHTFGICFDTGHQALVTLGLSPKSAEIAKRDAQGNSLSFDEAKAQARAMWNKVLSRIDAQFDDPRDTEIFYSNLYHTLTKPCDYSGESFLYDEDAFVLDFATLWDQYKTQLPLIFSLYPDISRKIVETLFHYAEKEKRMPHTLMMRKDNAALCASQARMLAEHALADAYLRGVPFDVHRALELSYQDAFEEGHFDEYVRSAADAPNKSFVIDITDGCAACALMARETGASDLARRFDEVARQWPNVFDPATGLIRDGRFYEGTKWNYSFRLMHDMPSRMALTGGKEAFAALADRFFGFSDDDSAGRFEGFNNETDMEAPYVYHFAGRHDRLNVILDSSMGLFSTSRGGLPGNNDSGGLSSCYLWNTMGIFPVSGQDLMIVGLPRARQITLSLANGKSFEILRHGNGIQVQKALLNARKLTDLSFSVRDMMKGGQLDIYMTG